MKPTSFDHVALGLKQNKMLVYTAMSKHYFYFRMHISKYVLEKEKVPLNPFMLFDYFLLDAVERDLVREANNSLVLRADEIWVFGPISNGVLTEILLGSEAGKPIHYFKIDKPHTIIPIEKDLIDLEEEVEEYKALLCDSVN